MNIGKIIKIIIGAVAVVLLLIFGNGLWGALESRVPVALESRLNHFFGRKTLAERRVPKTDVAVAIPEGSNLKEIAAALSAKQLGSEDEFFRFAGRGKVDYRLQNSEVLPKDYAPQFSFLKDKPSYYSLEGYLFPDTYRFYTSATDDEIITKMLENFDKKLTPKMRADIAAQGKSIFQIITMASVIEKEAAIDYSTIDNRDARLISGIFWKRLKTNQALQSCATLAYVLGENKAQYSEADTKVDSPFNTYLNKGLPPAPISNPGILAIEAAIYPLDSSYNFFLTPSGTKQIVFASTYAEHLANKQKYLR